MVEFQWPTGLRPSEVCKLWAGQIDRTSDPDLWIYGLSSHKTKKSVGKRKIYLSAAIQKLIGPYLEGKNPNDPLFTVEDSVNELKVARRAARKSKRTPSQIARDEHRAANPRVTFSETYDLASYRRRPPISSGEFIS